MVHRVQKHLDHAKKSATDTLKTTSKRAIQKTESTCDLISNKITDKIKQVSRASPQNSSEAVKNEAENIWLDREIIKEIYIAPEKRQKTIDDLRLIW